MKRIALAFVLCTVAGAAVADTGACYTITDPDARAYCQAKIRKDPSTCYTISDSSKRAICMAEVRG